MLKRLWEEGVVPLLKCRCYVWTCLFGLVLAYGFYLTNASMSKDVLWHNVCAPATYSLFGGAAQWRWGMGLLMQLAGLHGWSLYVSGLVGLLLWACAATLTVARLNQFFAVRNGWFSALFLLFSMTSSWGPEILAYPNFPVVIGAGALAAVLSALYTVEFLKSGSLRTVFFAGLWLSVCASVYEPLVSYYAILVALLMFVDCWRNATAFFDVVQWRRIGALALMGGGALVVKGVLSFAVVCVGRLVTERTLSGEGADTGISWLTEEGGATALTLAKHLVREFVYRAASSFPAFCVTASLIVFGLLAVTLAVRRRKVSFIIWGGAVLFAFILLPLVQGRIIGNRVFVPSCALFLAAEVYLLQFVRRGRALLYAGSGVAAFVFVTNLTVTLHDITLRYEFDRHHALMMLHDLGQAVGQTEKPVVFVGRIFADVGPKDRLGVVYPMQRVYAPFGAEYYQEKLYVTGGGAGQATLLAPIQPERRTEFYRFLYLLGGFSIKEPSESMERQAQDYVLAHKTPVYPNRGYIAETEDMIVVNLGIPRLFRGIVE